MTLIAFWKRALHRHIYIYIWDFVIYCINICIYTLCTYQVVRCVLAGVEGPAPRRLSVWTANAPSVRYHAVITSSKDTLITFVHWGWRIGQCVLPVQYLLHYRRELWWIRVPHSQNASPEQKNNNNSRGTSSLEMRLWLTKITQIPSKWIIFSTQCVFIYCILKRCMVYNAFC